jgi:hypothetical protein
VRDRRGIVAIAVLEAHLDVVVLVDRRVDEPGHPVVAADHEPHRHRDVLDVDAEVGGPVAVDHDAELRLVELERRVGVGDAAHLEHARAQLLGRVAQRLEVRPADVEVDVDGRAAQVEGGRVPDGDAEVAVALELGPERLHHVALRVVAAERGERIEPQEPADEPGEREVPLRVRLDAHVGVTRVHVAEEAAADGGEHGLHAGRRADVLHDRPHRVVHRGDAGAFRRRDPDVELRLVDVARHVLLMDRAIERHRRQHDDGGEDRDGAPVVERPREPAGIGRVEPRVEPPRERAGASSSVFCRAARSSSA